MEFQYIRGEIIFDQTQKWLDKHPTETVLIKVAHATASGSDSTKAPSNCDRSKATSRCACNEVFNGYRFWKASSTPVRWPTLLDARGKMVLIADYKNGPSNTIRAYTDAEAKDVWALR